MIRPPLITSIATSSAARSGWSRRGKPFPTIAIFMRLVRRTSVAAMMFGAGIVPHAF
jgi:hypothetical protein